MRKKCVKQRIKKKPLFLNKLLTILNQKLKTHSSQIEGATNDYVKHNYLGRIAALSEVKSLIKAYQAR